MNVNVVLTLNLVNEDTNIWFSIFKYFVDVPSVIVRIVPNKDIVRVGENLDLRCDVMGDPDPNIRWSKLNGDFEPNVLPYDSVLKITDVTYDNGGVSAFTFTHFEVNLSYILHEIIFKPGIPLHC